METMSAEFVNAALHSPSPLTQNPQSIPVIQGTVNPSPLRPHMESAAASQESKSPYTNAHIQQQPPSQDLTLEANHQHQHQPPQAARPAEPPAPSITAPPGIGANSPTLQRMTSTSISASAASTSASAVSILQPEPFKSRIAHLLTDERRFHAPTVVLERVHQFFKGPPQLDAAAFEGSVLNALISVPFPDIMDTDGWRVPATFNSGDPANTEFAPVQSCFLHVPILPSKRRYETDTEVIMLDDVRLAGQLNAKLWEEFSSGRCTYRIVSCSINLISKEVID